MQLKQEQEEEPRKHYHLVKKFAKAAKWAQKLREICAARGDAKSALEAEAYSAWMTGTNLLEREEWSQASEAFVTVQRVYTELGRSSVGPTKAMFSAAVEEVQPLLVYCQHCLRQLGGAAAEGEQASLRALSAGHGFAQDMLQAKLDALLDDSRRRQVGSVATIHWLGVAAPVHEEAVQMNLLKARDLSRQTHSGAAGGAGGEEEDRGAAFTAILACLDEALRNADAGRRKAATQQGSTTETVLSEYGSLDGYLQCAKLRATLRRHRALLAALLPETADAGAGVGRKRKAETGSKRVKPKEIAHVFDRMLQSLEGLSALPGGSTRLQAEVAARAVGTRQARTFSFAGVYYSQGDWSAAHTLYDHCAQTATAGAAAVDDWRRAIAAEGDDTDELTAPDVSPDAAMAEMTALAGRARAAAATCIAQAVLAGEHGAPLATAAASSPTATSSPADARKDTLLDRLEVFDPSRGLDAKRIAEFPPALEIISCPPMTFDCAFKSLQFPDLAPRMGKRQRQQEEKRQQVGEEAKAVAAGAGSGFFGWWRR